MTSPLATARILTTLTGVRGFEIADAFLDHKSRTFWAARAKSYAAHVGKLLAQETLGITHPNPKIFDQPLDRHYPRLGAGARLH